MEGHVTSTIFCKFAVTKVHTRHKGMKSDLADLMAHKEGTAERFYRLKEKEKACIQTASSLTTIMRSAELKKGIEGTLPTATTSHNVSLAADDRNNEERMLWDEEQVVTLKDVFCTEIENKSITMAGKRFKSILSSIFLTQERCMTRFEVSGALMTKATPNLQMLMTTNLQLNSPPKVLNCPKQVTL